jgi:hypothetical protein
VARRSKALSGSISASRARRMKTLIRVSGSLLCNWRNPSLRGGVVRAGFRALRLLSDKWHTAVMQVLSAKAPEGGHKSSAAQDAGPLPLPIKPAK